MLVNVFSVERQTQQVDRAGTSSAQQSTAGPLCEPSCSFYPEPRPVCWLDRWAHCSIFWKMTEILQCSEAPKGGTTSLLRKVENSWELLCVKDFKHHIWFFLEVGVEVETKEPFNIAGLQSPFFIYSFYSSLKNEAGKGLNGMDLKKNKGKDKTKPNFWLWNPKRNSFCFGIVFFVFCWLPFFFFLNLHHFPSEFYGHLFSSYYFLVSVH